MKLYRRWAFTSFGSLRKTERLLQNLIGAGKFRVFSLKLPYPPIFLVSRLSLVSAADVRLVAMNVLSVPPVCKRVVRNSQLCRCLLDPYFV